MGTKRTRNAVSYVFGGFVPPTPKNPRIQTFFYKSGFWLPKKINGLGSKHLEVVFKKISNGVIKRTIINRRNGTKPNVKIFNRSQYPNNGSYKKAIHNFGSKFHVLTLPQNYNDPLKNYSFHLWNNIKRNRRRFNTV